MWSIFQVLLICMLIFGQTDSEFTYVTSYNIFYLHFHTRYHLSCELHHLHSYLFWLEVLWNNINVSSQLSFILRSSFYNLLKPIKSRSWHKYKPITLSRDWIWWPCFSFTVSVTYNNKALLSLQWEMSLTNYRKRHSQQCEKSEFIRWLK